MRGRALLPLSVAALLVAAGLFVRSSGDASDAGAQAGRGPASAVPGPSGDSAGGEASAPPDGRRDAIAEAGRGGPEPEGAPPTGVVFGTVTTPFGAPIPGVSVTLVHPRRLKREDGSDGETVAVAPGCPVSADVAGAYRIETGRGGYFRVEASAEGFRTEVAIRHISTLPFEERIDFRLGRERNRTIRGTLLDARGAPLPADEIRFLFADEFPDASDANELGVSGVFAQSLPFRPPGERSRETATIDAERGTFEIRSSVRWEGWVSAVFRDQAIAETRWKDGDPEIELRIDAARVRSAVGTLEVRVVEAGTRAPVADAEVRVDGHALGARGFRRSSLPVDEGEPLRLENLPAGRYALVASCDGFGEAVTRADVSGGKTTRVEIALRRSAEVTLRLVPVEGWTPGFFECEVTYREPGGCELDCVTKVERAPGERIVRLSRAPPGEGVLVIAGNVLPVTLASGPNGTLDFPVARPRPVVVRWAPGETRPATVAARLLARRVVPVSETSHPAWPDQDGRIAVGLVAPPGSYTLEFEADEVAYRREVVVGAGDETELVAGDPK